MDKTIAEIPKNSREKIVVALSEFSPEGRKVFDMIAARIYFDDGAGNFKPGKNGLNIPTRLLPQLVTALQQAETEARAAGLIEGDVDDGRTAEPSAG